MIGVGREKGIERNRWGGEIGKNSICAIEGVDSPSTSVLVLGGQQLLLELVRAADVGDGVERVADDLLVGSIALKNVDQRIQALGTNLIKKVPFEPFKQEAEKATTVDVKAVSRSIE